MTDDDVGSLANPEPDPDLSADIPADILDGLTKNQRNFLRLYLQHGNGTDAYLHAGYAVQARQSAAANACLLLKHPRIAAAIQAFRYAFIRNTRLYPERTMQELACIAYLDPQDVLDFSGEEVKTKPAYLIPEHARRAIAGMETTSRSKKDKKGNVTTVTKTRLMFNPKNDALKTLGHFQGLSPVKKVEAVVDHKHIHGHVNIDLDALDAGTRKIVEDLLELPVDARRKMLRMGWVPLDAQKALLAAAESAPEIGLKELTEEIL